ncbi:hypothetical protein [Sulfurospirillum cavolei]|uniref:hypothetical protein n=1 Tax=Sulfurospirillum cavolei TaxID=366522 RepID=UPI000764B087|nr:hypothetical protein [Sulfurospirillum cavolei]
MNKAKIFSIIVAMGGAIFLSGCGASGQQFTQFAKPQPDLGLVYVYRPSAFLGSGVYYDVHVTNSSTQDYVAGELVNGSYVQVAVPVGENEVWGQTESKSSVTLDVKQGETYCVRGSVGIGFIVGRPNLEIVDMATCQAQIVETKATK